MHSVHPREQVDQAPPLSREKAERLAWELYGTDEPAVVELLLLADREPASRFRYAADQALELFRPDAERPLPEPAALEALRWCFYAHDLQERKRVLPFLLARLDRWAA